MNNLTADDYAQLAQIMSGPHGDEVSAENPADLLIVFCSDDLSLAETTVALYRQGAVKHIIFSGDVGKDSGNLVAQGVSEALFQSSWAVFAGLPRDVYDLEEMATNGKQNAMFSLDLAEQRRLLLQGRSHRIASLAPAVRSRRLYEELAYQTKTGGYPVSEIGGLSSGVANPKSESVQEELVRELRGLTRMHLGEDPRISPQPDFLPGGKYRHLVVKAGIADQ